VPYGDTYVDGLPILVVYKQRKVELQSIINDLDIVAEVRDLTEPEQENLAQS
jgi:hypothetical protein